MERSTRVVLEEISDIVLGADRSWKRKTRPGGCSGDATDRQSRFHSSATFQSFWRARGSCCFHEKCHCTGKPVCNTTDQFFVFVLLLFCARCEGTVLGIFCCLCGYLDLMNNMVLTSELGDVSV